MTSTRSSFRPCRLAFAGVLLICSALNLRGELQAADIYFKTDIVPILTKLGCNGGGCHGKATGQNGFQLSLFGFDPDQDYESLVRESRGRRLSPALPDRSLLLLKATARMPHGGGRRVAASIRTHQRCGIAPYGSPRNMFKIRKRSKARHARTDNRLHTSRLATRTAPRFVGTTDEMIDENVSSTVFRESDG